MQHSTERILTTHTGSLPRPKSLLAGLVARDHGELSGDAAAALPGQVADAVRAAVHQQAEAGVDIVNDGEMGKIGYSTYVKDRLTGFTMEEAGAVPAPADLIEYPEFAMRILGELELLLPACTGPVGYRDPDAVALDTKNLRSALAGVGVEDSYLSAASPGVISLFLPNHHYPDHESYVMALAGAMKVEYDAVHESGFLLQLDCPDLAMGRHIQFSDATLDEFRRNAELHVEALNRALADIPPDRLRMHLCWGNYEGPHHHDVALRDIIDIVFEARPQAILMEAANPRHEHEWALFEDVKLPDDKILVPGVIDSTSNYIEHPELVCQRILRYANLVGREQVMAGTDCGFGTFAVFGAVDPGIVWAKFNSLSEGAKLASRRLW